MRLTLIRTRPPTGAEALKPRLLSEIASDVQRRLNSGRALAGEISPKFDSVIFEAVVLGDGIVVRTTPTATPKMRTLDELLYPRASLDPPGIRDTVSAAVSESLRDMDTLLTRANT